MPRLPGTCTVSAPVPRTTVLLDLTMASVPMAVAWLRLPLPTLAPKPISVLYAPWLLARPVRKPKKELPTPVSFVCPAYLPKKEFWKPNVLLCPADEPKNELPKPKPTMLLASVMLFSPALLPTNRLSAIARSTRWPPKLYCVAAFTMLPESVAPAVPSPLTLKFEDDCWLFVFWM